MKTVIRGEVCHVHGTRLALEFRGQGDIFCPSFQCLDSVMLGKTRTTPAATARATATILRIHDARMGLK